MPANPSPAALPRAVLFDLDGTLIDTIPDLASAIDATRTDYGEPPLGKALAAFYVGHGVEAFVTDALAHGGAVIPATPAEMVKRFRAHYAAVNGDQSVLFPGVLDGLRHWRAAVQALAVVTNKSTEFTLPLLQRMNIAPFFDCVVCGDTLPRRKPDPDPVLHACAQLGIAPAQGLFIGDSSSDALAARAAGMRALAVPYGYHGEGDVHALPVEAVVPTIAAAFTWAGTHW